MNYSETIEWLFSRLPMFQRVGTKAIKKDLTNIRAFCDYLDNPQDKFKSVHVAGTNGKGSTSHMISSVLQEAGYKVGLHTSPHLKDFRERTRINGDMMTEQFVIDFVQEHKQFIEDLKASFFEVSVAMGFQYFAEQQVDVAIIETGLGGRLDSTNILTPLVSIITNIGKDHTAVLGNNLSDIAQEKAGIIKPNTPLVIGKYTTETQPIFEKKAKESDAEIHYVQELDFPTYDTDLKGFYQTENLRTATVALQVLKKVGFDIEENHLEDGFNKVKENTNLRGRWDILQKNPMVVADTAHNPDGIKFITEQISNTPHEHLHLVLGFVNDKDVNAIIKMFPSDATYYFSAPDVPRKLDIPLLKKIVPNNLKASYFNSIEEALTEAKSNAGKNDFIYVGGSTFVVAEVI